MLVVIGGGPYGIATAARAIEKGIETVVVGRPLGFWTDNMPEGMYLRSGPDWHLDASGVHTFEAFLEERGIAAAEIDPVPIAVFLDYARWFQREKGVVIDERLVTSVGLDGDPGQGDWAKGGHRFQVRLDDGDSSSSPTRSSPPPGWGTSRTCRTGAPACRMACARTHATWCASTISPAPGS